MKKVRKTSRPYIRPAGPRQRLVQVTGVEEEALRASLGDLSCPQVFVLLNGAGGIYVDADQLRKWRALQDKPRAEHE